MCTGDDRFLFYQEYLNNSLIWDNFYNTNDCNTSTEIFCNIIKKRYDTCFPLEIISRKRAKDKKWITLSIRKSCNTKNKLYKKYLNRPTLNNKNNYKNYRNRLQKICKVAQTNYFHNLINDTKNSLTNLWKVFTPIINPHKNKNSRTIDKLNINRKIVNNPLEIANHFNNYFCNIGKKLSTKIPPTTSHFSKFLKNNNVNSMFFD